MFRRCLFWSHLLLGLIAGLVIALLAFTGAALAFEKQVLDLAEASRMQVQAPRDGAKTLPVSALLAKVREAYPEQRPAGLTLTREEGHVVAVSLGREKTLYLNPYSGDIVEPEAKGLRSFFHTMLVLHRWLALEGAQRDLGKNITGIAGAVFLILGISGLYLWFPRNWNARGFRAVALLRRGASGKARDWNWHNVFGFWFLPVIVVLAGTGVVISYRWASNLVFLAAGETPPVQGGGPGAGASTLPALAKPAPGAARVSFDVLVDKTKEAYPNWETLSLRLTNGRRGGGQGREGAGAGQGGERRGQGAGAENRPQRAEGENGPQAVQISVRETSTWPLFSSIQLSFHPYDGSLLATERFEDQSRGRRWRSWVRFLHTGEALGLIGQGLAFLACLAGLLLVWTGFALSWRRFFPKRC